VRLRPGHDRGRLLARLGRQPREVLADQAGREAPERRHRHALDAERRQHARHVVDERLGRDHDDHLLGTEPLRLQERQVRHAVQADGRLAAARAALDGHQARVLRDEVVLLLVEERRDGRQVLVLPELPVGSHAQPRLRRVAVTGGPALLGLQTRLGHRHALPQPVLASHERPLRRRHTDDLPVRDAHPPPRHDGPLDHAVAQLLVVVVALGVPVVQAAHGRVAPVDDPDPLPRVDVRARADEHVPAALGRHPGPSLAHGHGLLETHVTEVRRRAVDRAADAAPSLTSKRRQVVHLLEQRRQVLRLGHRHLVAQLEHAALVERPAPRRGHVGPDALVQRAPHVGQELQLLADDPGAFLVVLEPGDLRLSWRGRRQRGRHVEESYLSPVRRGRKGERALKE
jgi:hypothetical protein